MNNFKELTDFLDKYLVSYIIHSDCVEVENDLSLDNNNLTTLPESFGNLKVGGDLLLRHNKLTSLPESFGNLKIGGYLSLSYNKLTSLPDSFGNLKIGSDLYLHNNKLTSLPESFGNLKIGGVLWLYGNELTSLPESFGNLKIGGDLWLNYNNLTSLPESFGNLKIGGNLTLEHNNLTSLPESFGNLKIGGGLFLNSNKLTSLPEITKMNQTIEKDWCCVDGIVREIVSKKKLKDLSVIKTHFDYIVGVKDTWAHGKTIEEAIQDYNFKLIQANPDVLKDLDLDKPMSHKEAINVYRTITRACREGIRQWMSGKTFPEQITIREIINLTQSAYGGKKFKQFFNQ
jgi:Leucine-rich repeat (LRR) protein